MGEALREEELYPRRREPLSDDDIWKRELKLRKDITSIGEGGMGFFVLYTMVLRDVFKVVPQIALGYSLGEPGMIASLGLWPDPSPMTEKFRRSPIFKERLHGGLSAVREYWGLREGRSGAPDAAFLRDWLGIRGTVETLAGQALLLAAAAGSLLVVAIYPLMKRLTAWPQVVLGFAFNWGALLSWAVVRGEIGWPAIALYAGGIAWTRVYDTIYAMQDQRDDTIVGVRSTARRFVGSPVLWLSFFAIISTLLFPVAIHLAGLGWSAWFGLAAVAAHLSWQIATLKRDDPADCLAKFQSNRLVGWLLLLGLIAGRAGA